MSTASIIINLTDKPQMHANGLSGTFIVPGKKPNEEFGILIVYPSPEAQDIGDNRKTIHWVKASPIAHDIVGIPRKVGGAKIGGSDSAAHSMGQGPGKEKWGLLLCEAEPDVPKELLSAVEAEIEYLTMHPTRIGREFDPVLKINTVICVDKAEVEKQKRENSETIEILREAFLEDCRKLVTRAEVNRAKQNLLMEDQRLVSEGDMRWAAGEGDRRNINNLHREACGRLGQERPWAYVPIQLTACPGCGTMIRENVLKCPSCNGWLDEGIVELAKMAPKERRIKMYPEQFDREPVAATGQSKGR